MVGDLVPGRLGVQGHVWQFRSKTETAAAPSKDPEAADSVDSKSMPGLWSEKAEAPPATKPLPLNFDEMEFMVVPKLRYIAPPPISSSRL